MKYYLIVGEASGDLHASHLMKALAEQDDRAEFRFFGGDLMQQVGGTRVKHYRELAYMGFIPVLTHLGTILRNMRFCKQDIVQWKPDVVILVDYPGFNLEIAKYVKKHTRIPVYYYISPKIWAWKEHRIKDIKRNVYALYSILPFEVPFYQEKHGYPVTYVGNPTMDEVTAFRRSYKESREEFEARCELDERPIIALLAGSRKQEIKDNLPLMIQGIAHRKECQWVLAGAPGIDAEYYEEFIKDTPVKLLFGETYPLLHHAQIALVTSGTATLETALLRVPQVVCYYTPCGRLVSWLRGKMLKVKYISLVNLIAEEEVVRELVADGMTVKNLRWEVDCLLDDAAHCSLMWDRYNEVARRLGKEGAAQRAAEAMIHRLTKR